MKYLIKKGATSNLAHIFIQDSSSTTGAGLTGLTSGSSGLVCYRARTDDGNAGATQITLSGGTRGTWSSGGFVEKDATNMPGVYELGIPDAAVATGSSQAVIMLKGATNMAPCVMEIQLVNFDPTDGVHLGLTCLPNTAVTTNASLLTSGTGTDQLSVTSGRVDAGKINGVSTSSVTTVNANQGTTQPINFTGTAGSALVKGDTIDINSIAASSVTTINANIGTTQPVNHTGTGASALVKSDTVDIAGSAVSTSSAQLGVNVVNWGGTATSGTLPPDAIFIRSGTAQAGGATTITLDAGASATNNLYQSCDIFIRSGTGAGQSNNIVSYVGATKVATVLNTWATNPDNTSVFTIAAFGPAPAANVSGTINANLVSVNSHAVTDTASGVLDVNAKNLGGTVQTGRDIGASVLLSQGTSAGQISLTSGQVTVSVNNDKTGYGLSSAEENSVADAILNRDISAGTDSGSPTFRTLRQAIRFLRNKWTINAGTLTVFKEDDTTSSWTAAVTTDGTAQPIIANDPAGP